MDLVCTDFSGLHFYLYYIRLNFNLFSGNFIPTKHDMVFFPPFPGVRGEEKKFGVRNSITILYLS